MKSMSQLIIDEVTEDTQEQAKRVVLSGLEERLGFLNESYNTDLNNIVQNYTNHGDVFLTGTLRSEVICTGALIEERKDVGRIVRMSVLKAYRRKGFARKMLEELEAIARTKKYVKIVLETTNTWSDAIQFYKSNGYIEQTMSDLEIHMEKNLL